MTRRSIAGALGLALVLVLLPATLAVGEFRGTDMWSNLMPGGSGGVANDVPISYYQLDYYVQDPHAGFSGVGAGDPLEKAIQITAAFIFMLATFAMRLAIYVFDWAFNLDIIGGRHGALTPVGTATQNLWTSTFLPLLKTAVVILGGWFAYKTLSRRFGEAGTGLLRAICLSAICLVIIFNPADTIGTASSLSKDLAGSIVSGTTGGNGGQSVSDRMFDTFIYKPWVVLEFSGLKHCVSSQHDDDGFPKPVGVDDQRRSICRNSVRQDSNGYGGYAEKFLRYPNGSDERKKLYEGIKDGEEPIDEDKTPPEPMFAGWNVDKADAPGVDMMQAGGAVQRLAYVLIITFGIVAAIMLLGLIAFAALFAQLGLLVLYGITPAMVLVAISPGMHGVFWGWAQWIGKFLVALVVYSVILAAAMGVSAAIMGIAGESGYLLALLLQSSLFIGLVVFRKKLAAPVTGRREYNKSEQGAKAFVTTAAAASVGAVTAPASTAAWAVTKKLMDNQEHAADPGAKPGAKSGGASSDGSPKPADSSSPPASAGREHSPAPPLDPANLPVTSDADQLRRWNAPMENNVADKHAVTPETTPTRQIRGDEPLSKSFQEEYESAKVERANGQQPSPSPMPDPKLPARAGTNATPFSEALEQERAKTPNT